MLLRRIMLALGAVALIVGVGLLVLWMRESSQQVSARRANLPQQSVLVAARPIPTGTLLRAPDIMWRAMSPAEVPPNGYLRAKSSEGELIGAVVTRSYRQGEAFTSDLLVKPSEPGFLPAVLAPGMRAVSIAVGLAEGTSGLIAPGDRVDVILTQVFQDPSISVTQRSVGETVLRNLRVIAIDQSISPTGKPEQSSVRAAASSQPRVPKTITLEVNSRQAETLMVANQLGKIELALRSLNEPPPGLAGPATDEPT
jgi:pilus assembly protein CpaB